MWKMCNGSLSYTEEFSSVIEYHRNFSLKSELRALIYRYICVCVCVCIYHPHVIASISLDRSIDLGQR